jgi:hypothetical protein
VQRIIKDAKAQQTSMAETAANSAAASQSEQHQQQQQQQTDVGNGTTTESAPAPTQNSHFDYVPDLPVDQKEILELDDDGGMSALLKGLKDDDPFAELAEQKAEDSSSNDAPSVAAAAAAPADDVFSAPLQDDNELESMIQSLIATEPTTTLGQKKSNSNKGRSKAPKRSTIVHQTPSQQRKQPPNNNNNDIIHPQVPVECIRTQIVLYVEHFGESLLQNLVGRTDTERKAFIKSLKNMDRSELTHWLSSCKGYITINNSVAMIKNSVYMGCSLIENCAPLIDMNCNGLTQSMKDQQDEINMCATEYAISNYSWLAAKQSPEIRLGTMVISCAMACDNKNRIISHHRAQQEVSQELQNKYQSM